MSDNTKTPRKKIDWDAIEPDYCAGVLSLREVALKHGCSHVGLMKTAKERGWVRSLAAKIQAKAEAMVTTAVTTPVTSMSPVTERAVIDANAALVATIRSEHRRDIGRARALVGRLLGRIESLVESPELFEELGEAMKSPGVRQDRLQLIYRKVIDLPQNIKGLKELSEALRMLFALEREAYGIAPIASGQQADDGQREVVQFYLPNNGR